ncbi:MAG: sugar nucleotide-binding protein, partial [Acidimicrobiia bacterium]|nr:sugar nucleotide-binding protein [Acidimicrobiia bacterium]
MQRTLIIGASGQVGTALVGQLGARAIPLTRSELDITDLSSIEAAVQQHPASAVINCAAFTAVDLAESEAELADLINHRAVAEMARVTASLDIPFIT